MIHILKVHAFIFIDRERGVMEIMERNSQMFVVVYFIFRVDYLL